MKRNVLAVIMALVLGLTAMSAAMVQPALAEGDVDFSGIAGYWYNADSSDETLTITEDGLFFYEKDGEVFQGYLEYVDEYGDGNGRYDMYNRYEIWQAGLYQDSEDSIHMGNDEEVYFLRGEDAGDWMQYEPCILSAVQYADMVPLYNDPFWYDGYYKADMTEDGILVIVNCCAAIMDYEEELREEYRRRFAEIVSEAEAENYEESQNQEMTAKLTYPAYDLTFTTGSNEDTCLWKMLFFQTDTYTYAYAFKMDADSAEELEAEYWYAVSTLELIDASYGGEDDPDDDPSANGESKEEFIAFFDHWYLCGDLNAESIRIDGDGTWAFYNAVEEDGTGGYLFDDGTFDTLGNTVLQLYSSDGTNVANVSLTEAGELLFTPVAEGYADYEGDMYFYRESESIAFEAQPTEG